MLADQSLAKWAQPSAAWSRSTWRTGHPRQIRSLDGFRCKKLDARGLSMTSRGTLLHALAHQRFGQLGADLGPADAAGLNGVADETLSAGEGGAAGLDLDEDDGTEVALAEAVED